MDISPTSPAHKKTFDIPEAFRLLRKAVRPYPRAAMFQLAQEGGDSLFAQLVGCMISVRTLDEVSLPATKRLLEKAPTARKLAALSVEDIDTLIQPCTFHNVKAWQLQRLAREIHEEYHGKIPANEKALLSFHGIGPKCAHLALGIACRQPFISVDTHVHRIVQRWGLVQAATPEKTMLALMRVLPQSYWIEINKLLVPFGKHICTSSSPRCSRCLLLSMCQQRGVTTHR